MKYGTKTYQARFPDGSILRKTWSTPLNYAWRVMYEKDGKECMERRFSVSYDTARARMSAARNRLSRDYRTEPGELVSTTVVPE